MSRFFAVLAAISLIAMFSSCRTPPEEAPQPEPTVAVEPEGEAEPEPLDIEWSGTSWIRDDDDSARDSLHSLPKYDGYYLAEDGALLVVNETRNVGDGWKVEGNRLILSYVDGKREEYVIYPDDEGFRLRPVDSPEGGSVYRSGKSWVDLEENHWIPVWIRGAEDILPPQGAEIFMMILPSTGGMGITGYGGVNHFSGPVIYDDSDFLPGALAVTRKAGPGSEYESRYLGRLDEVNRYVQVRNELYLYSDAIPVITFRMILFD